MFQQHLQKEDDKVVVEFNMEGTNSHVFQCHNEANRKHQFNKTVEALSKYIKKNLQYPNNISSLCHDYKINKITVPTDLSNKDLKCATKALIWKETVGNYAKRTEIKEGNLQSIYSVILGTV